jgi:hypothetical protein
MYTLDPIFSRFEGDFLSEQAPHWLRVRFTGSEWQYAAVTGWKSFTPETSDVLVAKMQNNVLTLFEAENSWYEGIHKGYAAADETFNITMTSTCDITVTGALITVWNCNQRPSIVYAREGVTLEDEFFMSKEACPLTGRYGEWTVRRYNKTDFINVETGDVELRGEATKMYQDVARCTKQGISKSSQRDQTSVKIKIITNFFVI